MGNIHDYIDYSSISISGKWFVKDLKNNFNIQNKKSLTCNFPFFIPKQYYSHFLRGFFDGDGCITIPKTTKCLLINFTSNYKMLNSIRNLLMKWLNILVKSKNKSIPVMHNKNTGQLHFSGKNAIKILNWLYQNSDNLRMERKYKKYIPELSTEILLDKTK